MRSIARTAALTLGALAAATLAPPAADAVSVKDWMSADGLMIDLNIGRPTTVGMRQSAGELYLEFSNPLGDPRDLERLAAAHPAAIADIQFGQNSVLLRTNPGADVRVWSTPQGARLAVRGPAGQGVVAPTPPAASSADGSNSDRAAAERRLEVLRGRVELATGRPEAARTALEAAARNDPADPETLTALAAAESELGRTDRALAYLDRAISARPDDPNLARDRARLLRDQAAFIEVNGGWRETDDSDRQSRAGFILAARFGERWRVGAEGFAGHVRADAVQRADGRTTTANDAFGAGQVSAAYRFRPEHETEGTLHGAEHGPGAGLTHRIGPATARTTLSAGYGAPHFDDVAGILDEGRKHHVQIGHERRFDRDWRASVGGALNQYGVADDDNVARTGAVTATVRRRVYSQAPFYVDAGYSFDGEYEIDVDTRRDALGATFNPLPIDSREVHFGDVSASVSLAETVTASTTVGYGFDRFGGDGATFAGSVEWEPSATWKLGLSAGHSFAATRGDNASVINFGFYVRRSLGSDLAPSATPTEPPR